MNSISFKSLFLTLGFVGLVLCSSVQHARVRAATTARVQDIDEDALTALKNLVGDIMQEQGNNVSKTVETCYNKLAKDNGRMPKKDVMNILSEIVVYADRIKQEALKTTQENIKEKENLAHLMSEVMPELKTLFGNAAAGCGAASDEECVCSEQTRMPGDDTSSCQQLGIKQLLCRLNRKLNRIFNGLNGALVEEFQNQTQVMRKMNKEIENLVVKVCDMLVGAIGNKDDASTVHMSVDEIDAAQLTVIEWLKTISRQLMDSEWCSRSDYLWNA